MIIIYSRADCKFCHGSGTVTDWVPYGMGNTAMDSDCDDCISAGWPEDADPEADYNIVPAWHDEYVSEFGKNDGEDW